MVLGPLPGKSGGYGVMRLLVTEANGVLDLVYNTLGGATMDLVVLLAAGLVESFLSSRLRRVGLSASSNAYVIISC